MIATLTGTIAEKLAEQVVLDVRGVGYGLLVTTEDFGRLTSGQAVKLYIYEHIREQSHDLFGFLQLDTKRLFEQLLDVKNVGPKVALAILDIGSAQTVRAAIAAGDVKQLQTAKGVGKRAAEQIVVELKDKVGLVGVDLESAGLLQSETLAQQDEAVAALITLGYTPHDAIVALQVIEVSLPTEERIKLALRGK